MPEVFQAQLAEKTGMVQTLVSDYKRGKLRLNADVILRFATVLGISTDALLPPVGPIESKSRVARFCGDSKESKHYRLGSRRRCCARLIRF